MSLKTFIDENPNSSYKKIRDKSLARHIQSVLIWHKLLKGKPDGRFGRLSNYSLNRFKKIHGISEAEFGIETAKALYQTSPHKTQELMLSTQSHTLSRIVARMRELNYQVFTSPKEVNIVYVQGMNPNFQLNADTPDIFNDLAICFDFDGANPRLLGKWVATDSPGKYYTDNPLNPRGALICRGQYKAWQVGQHGTFRTHEALVQRAVIKYTRDTNRDFLTTGDITEYGKYNGANCHGSRFNMPGKVGKWSAGCKVIAGFRQQRDFMEVVKSDPNYLRDRNFLYTVATVDGSDLLSILKPPKPKPAYSREVVLMAQTLWGEARGETYAGRVAVANVIKNRYKISLSTKEDDWWGNTISQIVLQPYQFSCHNSNDPNKPKLAKLDDRDRIYRESLEIAQKVLSGEIKDSTGGATHYFAYKVVKPRWAAQMRRTKRIGNHDFYL